MKSSYTKFGWYLYFFSFSCLLVLGIIELFSEQDSFTFVNITHIIALIITMFGVYVYIKNKPILPTLVWKIIFFIVIPWNLYTFTYELYVLLNKSYWLSWVILITLTTLLYLPSSYAIYKNAFRKNA